MYTHGSKGNFRFSIGVNEGHLKYIEAEIVLLSYAISHDFKLAGA